MSSLLSSTCNLWTFSLYHYARPGVSEVCLRLQDEYGVNVNIVFWTLWLGFRGQVLDAAQLAQTQRKAQSWDLHYILPLRQLRRRLKVEFGTSDDSVEAVRVQIKQAELLAEKHQQQMLESIPGSSNASTELSAQLMERNLRLYLSSMAVNENLSHTLLGLINDCQ